MGNGSAIGGGLAKAKQLQWALGQRWRDGWYNGWWMIAINAEAAQWEGMQFGWWQRLQWKGVVAISNGSAMGNRMAEQLQWTM
jgi:hypothetical protein